MTRLLSTCVDTHVLVRVVTLTLKLRYSAVNLYRVT